MNRAGPGLAGAELATRRIWNGNWEIRFDEAVPGRQPAQHLQAVCEEFTLQLALDSAKPPVIHGVDGVSQKAAGRGQASHYISYTRLGAQGTLALGGRTMAVEGLAWMDHEFFTHQLTAEQTGWDWFALQLDDGTALMFYALRDRDGSRDPHSAGTWVESSGEARLLESPAVAIEVTGHWTTADRVHYPSGWRLRVPSLALDVSVHPVLADQELKTSPRYFEGAVDVSGTREGRVLRGRGYVELVGYAR